MTILSTNMNECSSAACHTNDSVDIDAAIASILADPNCVSLELPCLLTAEQRKLAKRAVAEHPDLKCESFGMGGDRRLHVFRCKPKEGANLALDCSPHRVNVKNTFIDDWVDTEGVSVDRRVVQSMPHNMFGQCLSAELSEHSKSSVEERGSTPPLRVNEDAASAKCGTAQDLRLVEEQVIVLGTPVVIDGLIKSPGFNGSRGVVQSWDAASGRYNVLLSSSVIGGHRFAKVKAENLQPCEA